MLRDLTLGQYLPGNSFVHCLDSRTKITLTILLMAGVFFIHSWQGYLVLTVLIIAGVGIARIPLKFFFRGLKPLTFILVLTLVLYLFTTPGRVILSLGPLKITYEGVVQGAEIIYRLVLLIMIASLLTLTTSPITLTDGVEALLKPFRRFGVPAHELAMMMTIALRFVPTLLEETEKIMKAQMSRGANFSSGRLVERAKSFLPLLVPLFISAFRRADELALAMEARCYRGGEERTRLKQLRMAGRDYLTFAVCLGGLLVAIIW